MDVPVVVGEPGPELPFTVPLGKADCHHSADAVTVWKNAAGQELRMCYHCTNRSTVALMDTGWTIDREDYTGLDTPAR